MVIEEIKNPNDNVEFQNIPCGGCFILKDESDAVWMRMINKFGINTVMNAVNLSDGEQKIVSPGVPVIPVEGKFVFWR